VTTIDESHVRTADARLERAFGLVAEPRIKLLTLDVFDTLLFRRVTDPVDAFPLVAEGLRERGLLGPDITSLGFKALRRAAESRARGAREASGRGVEVALEDIYMQFPRFVLRGASAGDAAAVEVDVERGLLVPDLDVLELVRAARAAGKQVAAVSDTYFSGQQLRSFMSPVLFEDAPVDHVFASSDHGEGKTQGLFAIVMRELGVQPDEVVHVGDNEEADVEGARRHGIRALPFDRRPKELERVLDRERSYVAEDEDPASDAGTTALRGKVLHRREHFQLPEELRPFWAYGATALGPAFSGFAAWVQRRAVEFGVPRVFCLMREGELLGGLIGAAGEYMDTGVTAEPLWLSRQVCARASIFEAQPAELRELLARRRPPTVAEFCATLGVPVDGAPLLADNAAARLGDGELADDVIEELSSNPDLRAPIVSNARLLRERVVAYVEGLLPEGERQLVLVDLGWGGSIQKMLADVLRRSGSDIHLTGLYLVTDARATDRMLEWVELSGFLAGQGVPSIVGDAIMRSPEILEQACMPDVGSQLDLNSDLEPVLAESADRDLEQSAERAAVQKGIRAFQREWMRYAAIDPARMRLDGPGVRRRLLAQVARATVAPTAGEAAAFGRWVHDENFGSVGHEPIVGDSHAARVLRHVDPETLFAEIPMREIYWPFGLATLADEHLAESASAIAMGLVPAEAFYSQVEAGDVEVYYDNGFGFSQEWSQTAGGRRNRYGLSYARTVVRGDEVRGVRIDPVRAPCVLRVDWIALTCWVRGESAPRRLVFDTHAELSRWTQRGLDEIGAKLFMVPGDDPQFELDLRAALGGAYAYEVLVEIAYAVLLVDPRGPDAAETRELARRAEARSKAAKRFVRQVETRSGVRLDPLRRAWRRLRSRGA
jgi:HAD superfamily hydrolase (TIGR01549 family)